MKGAQNFVDKNFRDDTSIFESCVHAIVYGYLVLSRKKTYSRSHIVKETTRVRGKKARIVELEDYLRNDLVSNFIEPNLTLFHLQNYLFIAGAEESLKNIKTGILDIKICSPRFTGSVYYIFECKRLNKEILNGYLDEGIHRFVNNKYYPATFNPLGGMISFLESSTDKNRIDINSSFAELNAAIKKKKRKLRVRKDLSKYPLKCESPKGVSDFQYVYCTTHTRTKNNTLIDLYHIVLDYNKLVVV